MGTGPRCQRRTRMSSSRFFITAVYRHEYVRSSVGSPVQQAPYRLHACVSHACIHVRARPAGAKRARGASNKSKRRIFVARYRTIKFTQVVNCTSTIDAYRFVSFHFVSITCQRSLNFSVVRLTLSRPLVKASTKLIIKSPLQRNLSKSKNCAKLDFTVCGRQFTLRTIRGTRKVSFKGIC